MPPQCEKKHQPTTDMSCASERQPAQSLYIIRHGDRWDYAHPEWKKSSPRPGDPSLSVLGFEQARQVGQFLDEVMVEEGISADQIKLLSSPFLRTIQTSNELLSEMKETKASENVSIRLEHSVYELDMWESNLHASLPHDLSERRLYFPRIDLDHESAFVPDLPEDPETFFSRCEQAIECIGKAYPCDEIQNRVIIVVTHAACCIGLSKAAAGLELQDINAAAPCSIYRLNREIGDEQWSLDHYSEEGGMNGFTKHMTNMNGRTIPWNNFGDRSVNNGWTGPPTKE